MSSHSARRCLFALTALSFLSGCAGLSPERETADAVNALNVGAAAISDTRAAREKQAQKNFERDFDKRMRDK